MLKRRIALVALPLVLACAHAQQPNVVKGWVSDAMCAAEHVGGANPSCVKKCLTGGAAVGHPEWEAQAMVLVVDGTNQILTVDNPALLAGHEAQLVTVEGKVSGTHIVIASVK